MMGKTLKQSEGVRWIIQDIQRDSRRIQQAVDGMAKIAAKEGMNEKIQSDLSIHENYQELRDKYAEICEIISKIHRGIINEI